MAKKSLHHIMPNPAVVAADNPLSAFSEAPMNFYEHHAGMNIYQSGCKHHSEVVCLHTNIFCRKLKITIQPSHLNTRHKSDLFLYLLEKMSRCPQEYVTAEGHVTLTTLRLSTVLN